MTTLPMDSLRQAMNQHGLVRFVRHFEEQFPDTHMKDLVVDSLGPNREMQVQGRHVTNFGSDSFLGAGPGSPRTSRPIRDGLPALGHAQRRLAGLLQRARPTSRRKKSSRPGWGPKPC